MKKSRLVTAYFDDFIEVFLTFNGDRIAPKFTAPLLVKGTSFDPIILRTKQEISDYFQAYLDRYKKLGYASCFYSDLDIKWLGNDNAMATLEWSMVDSLGAIKTKWIESYLLTVSDCKTVAYCTIDHDLEIE
ncbi:MAG: hypothetical protein D6160_14465 [Ketobacter sp.]|nr:MAG: hypothetical protein D6160_14465 [Ketobacter sp.]